MMPCANYNFALRPIRLADINTVHTFMEINGWLN